MITGGGSGIGRACALMMAREGADIVIADAVPANHDRVAEEVLAAGREVVAMTTDTSEKEQVHRIVQAGIERFGKIDILLNAAGISGGGSIRDMSVEDFDRVMAVHVRSTFLCSQAVMESMIELGWGRIVNIISRASFKGREGTGAYAAAKAAMLGFSRSLAIEAGPYGITVNNVAPGYVRSPMTEANEAFSTEEGRRAAQEEIAGVTHPLRFVEPEEVAEAVMYYCGPNSSQVSGMTIHVNGGTLMP